MLGSSQHTVITYGTFGMWGALLSGGEVIAAKGTNNLTYSEVIISIIIIMIVIIIVIINVILIMIIMILKSFHCRKM